MTEQITRSELIRRVQAGETVIKDMPDFSAAFALPGTLKVGNYVKFDETGSQYDERSRRARIIRVQGTKDLDGVTVEGAEIKWEQMPTREELRRRDAAARRHCRHYETSNTGECYACGAYVAADDVGRLFS